MKPVFLISLPRAGSTLLQRILMQHSAIASKSEPWILLPLMYMVKSEGTVTEYNHRDAVRATHDFIQALPGKDDFYNQALHDFVMNLYQAHCPNNELLYLDKTPRYYLIIKDLAKMFPEAKFIFLVRNPIQIISSIISSFSNGTLRNLHFYHIDIFKGIDKMAEGISELSKRSIVVRYEDLVGNPNLSLKSIMEFLNLPWEPRIVESLGNKDLTGSMGDKWGTNEYKSIESKSTEKWKTVLNESVRKLYIKQIIKGLRDESLENYGYKKQSLIDELDQLQTKTTFSGLVDLKHIISSFLIKRFYLNLYRKNKDVVRRYYHKLAMEIRKADVINFLFVFCFPVYGIGKYIAQVGNYSAGQLISVSPLILILLFFAVDRLQQKEFEPKISPYYYLLLFFFNSMRYFVFYRLENAYPGSNLINSISLSLAILAIVHGAIVVQFYNSTNSSFSISSLLYWGLTIDIIVNLAGYTFGLRNPIHSIEGRLNLPFGQGFYSTANTVALLNILIIATLIQQRVDFRLKTFMILQFIANLYLIGLFNSRLSILIFLLIVILILTRAIRHQKILYFISLFTLPLLLSFAEFIYTILQLPGLNQLLKRVSYKDITGFNGRGHLWNRGTEWFLSQGEGFFLGNGYHGYYTIGLINDLEKYWFRSAVTMHMHSSTFEYLLSIGIVGVIPFMFLLYKSLNFIKDKMIDNHADGILLPALIYLLFLFQIDNYGYINNFGALIMITIISTFIVKRNSTENLITI